MTLSVIDCRLRGIYDMLKSDKYWKTRLLMLESLRFLKYAPHEIDCGEELLTHIANVLNQSLKDLKRRRYLKVHDAVRDLHFKIYCM